MYNDVMGRTQIYLGDEELDLLDAASARTGASRSELIRRAIRSQYGSTDFDARRTALSTSAGLWRDWPTNGEDYVESIRRDLGER